MLTEAAGYKRVKSSYVGVNVCKKCHESSAIGNQFKIWSSSPHAKAFRTLSTKGASGIGERKGIKNPAKNPGCLKCHNTGGGRNSALIGEGVGCEACHGPGSRYFEFGDHASFNNRENTYRNAITLGMYPILGDNGIKAREKLCRNCHTKKRLCQETDELRKNKEIQRELPLSIIADFIFRHPIP